MRLWREIEGSDDLDTDLPARDGDADVWICGHDGLWRCTPGGEGQTAEYLVENYSPVFQRFREPLPLVPTFDQEVIGEAAVTEPETRARALDAATRIIGQISAPEIKDPAVDWAMIAGLYAGLARALEPYLCGVADLIDAEVIEGA